MPVNSAVLRIPAQSPVFLKHILIERWAWRGAQPRSPAGGACQWVWDTPGSNL